MENQDCYVKDVICTNDNGYVLLLKYRNGDNCYFIKIDKLDKTKVSIEKPNAPINGIFKYVAVEITRSKKDYE